VQVIPQIKDRPLGVAAVGVAQGLMAALVAVVECRAVAEILIQVAEVVVVFPAPVAPVVVVGQMVVTAVL
jgi:hypothetical protein